MSCSFVWMFALLRAQNRIVHSQPASQPAKQADRRSGEAEREGPSLAG